MRPGRRSALTTLAAAAVLCGAAIASARTEPVPGGGGGAPTCPSDPETGECMPDGDRDGRADSIDNCPSLWNPYQEDDDGDGAGNACDSTPNGGGGGSGGGGGGGGTGGACSGTAIAFEHVNFGGRCWSFDGQVATLGDADDTISSIQVAPGYVATLFGDPNFGGRSYTTGTSDNPWGWTGLSNDDVSSIVVQSDQPSTVYSDGVPAAETIADAVYEYTTGGSCSGVGDAIKYANSIRTHWLYAVKVRFCWGGGNVTSVYSREVIADIKPIPFPVFFVQNWTYSAVDFQPGEAGMPSTVVRAAGKFEFCTLRFGCLNTRQPWIRIELFGEGRASCTTSVNASPHPCARF